MGLAKLLLLLPLLQSPTLKAPQSEWSYRNPERWGDDAPQCNGNLQSPIRLRGTTSSIFSAPPIRFGNYDVLLRGNLNFTNNGHSVEFAVPHTISGGRPFIAGGPLSSRYEAQNVHFHWGSANTRGSEHVIDNRRYDVEMHVVHRNVRYNTTEEAARYADGLAVLGVMFKIVNVPDRYYPGLYRVLNGLSSIVNYRSSVNITGPIALGQMLGDLNTKRYFTYRGSLTTPNCAEAVTWFVFPQPLAIARDQIRKFWSILDTNGNVLINNVRPLQRRNRRPVYFRAFGF